MTDWWVRVTSLISGIYDKKYNKFDWLAFKAVNMERRTGIIIDLDLSLYLKVQ